MRRVRPRGERLPPGFLEFVECAQPVIRHVAHFLERSAEFLELAHQVVDGGLHAIAHEPAAIRKEEVSRRSANKRANRGSGTDCITLRHANPP
jgi:hypothetical protein